MSNSAKGLPSCPYTEKRWWRLPQCAFTLQGEHCTGYTHSEKLNEAEQERQSGFCVFPFVHWLWKLQTCSKTCLCGRREDLPCWVRPKGSLLKFPPPACNKHLHKKHKKERKYGEILHLIHCPELPGSVIRGLPAWNSGHLCSDPLNIGKPLSHTHNTTAIPISCQLFSQATRCSSAAKSHTSKCLSRCQLRAIDVNGFVLLYTSWWSPSSPSLPSQQIFWCPVYKISIEKVDWESSTCCVVPVTLVYIHSLRGRCKSIAIGL